MAVALSFPHWICFCEIWEQPLVGVYTRQDKPVLEISSLRSGKFQEDVSVYVTENISGYRTMIRLNNQWRYSLLNESAGSEVVIGKEGYLYEQAYIDAWTGKDFLGEEEIRSRTADLKRLQDTLCAGGVESFIVFAPGKGSYYPEYIPDRFMSVTGPTNYDAFKTEMDRLDVNYIDLRDWFLRMKDTSQHELFPKTGVHWSKYGELLAADSMFHYVGSRIRQPLPELVIGAVHLADTVCNDEQDAERLMNLLEDIPDLRMSYVNWHIEADTTQKKPRTIVISDSYFWGMFNLGFSESVLDHGRFWFYGNTVYPDAYYTDCTIEDLSVPLELFSSDVVIWISTDANLRNFPFKVPEKFYGE